MPTHVLTDAKVRALKPSEKPQKILDGYGLHLFISPKGSKTWRIAFRVGKWVRSWFACARRL